MPTALAAGGVGKFISNELQYNVLERTSSTSFQALWIAINEPNRTKNVVVWSIDSTLLLEKQIYLPDW